MGAAGNKCESAAGRRADPSARNALFQAVDGLRAYYCWGIITFRADSAKLVYAALAPSAITSSAR